MLHSHLLCGNHPSGLYHTYQLPSNRKLEEVNGRGNSEIRAQLT